MKARLSRGLVVAGFLIGFGAVTVAFAADRGNTPGWMYARANCGPVATPPGTSLESCYRCCERGIERGLIGPHDRPNCRAYCDALFQQ